MDIAKDMLYPECGKAFGTSLRFHKHFREYHSHWPCESSLKGLSKQHNMEQIEGILRLTKSDKQKIEVVRGKQPLSDQAMSYLKELETV